MDFLHQNYDFMLKGQVQVYLFDFTTLIKPSVKYFFNLFL